MNRIELFEKILKGEITPKNYQKFKLNKSAFYKIYSRVLFFNEVTDPTKYMIINLSQREFQAVRNKQLKVDIKSKSKTRSFPHSVEKQSREVD
jgi:hypothetical protein